MKKSHVIPLFILILSSFVSAAQIKLDSLDILNYSISANGDTTYYDEIRPAMIHPKQTMSRKKWVQYYKRVHNFSKAYPYALLVSRVIKETDSLFTADGYSSHQKEKYLHKMKDNVLHDFDPVFRQLTLKQGLMMIRLIDREVGMAPYYIIKDYFNGATAGFWQGVAKLFKGDLKQPYDKFGEDKDLEELVGYWERGEFDDLYMLVFGKPRPEIFVPERFR